MELVKAIVQKLSGSNESEQVWVEGFGDVVAIIGDQNNYKYIRAPILIDKSKVPEGIKILDSKTLKEYNKAIKYVEDKRNKRKAIEALTPSS